MKCSMKMTCYITTHYKNNNENINTMKNINTNNMVSRMT